MAKKTNPIVIRGILEPLQGTYNNIQYCKNGVIRLYVNKSIKKIKDV